MPIRGADFHTAVVATAPGEKLLIGRRPVRDWTQPLAINDAGGNAVRYQARFFCAENASCS